MLSNFACKPLKTNEGALKRVTHFFEGRSTLSGFRQKDEPGDLARRRGFAVLVVGAELLRDRFQRWIELHKAVFDSGVGFVAFPARLFRIGRRGFVVRSEIEVGPLVRESSFILHFDRQPHQIGLEVSGFVDRAFGLLIALFQDEPGLVRPFAAGDELPVGPLRHKDIREHLASGGGGVVVHSQPGRKKDPFPVVFRADQTLSGESRDWVTRLGLGGQSLRLCGRGNETKRKNQAQKDCVLRHFASQRERSQFSVSPELQDYIANRRTWLIADLPCPVADLAPLPMPHRHD